MEWKCLKEVFKEFIAANIKIEIFKKIFLSSFLKKDSRPEGEISDWFINF